MGGKPPVERSPWHTTAPPVSSPPSSSRSHPANQARLPAGPHHPQVDFYPPSGLMGFLPQRPHPRSPSSPFSRMALLCASRTHFHSGNGVSPPRRGVRVVLHWPRRQCNSDSRYSSMRLFLFFAGEKQARAPSLVVFSPSLPSLLSPMRYTSGVAAS